VSYKYIVSSPQPGYKLSINTMSEAQNNFDSANLPLHCEPIVEDMSQVDRSQTTEESTPISSVELESTTVSIDRDLGTNDRSTTSINWQKLAHKLREHNRKLLKKVFQLEQELVESDSQLKQSLITSRQQESSIEQQAKSIKESQEQIANLLENVEQSQREIKTQQILIDTLSKQLEIAQQQTAQLERECALLQESYNQKTYESIAQEKQTQELHSRLTRQQRYTLQYKAALDRYLNNVTAESDSAIESLEISPEIKNQPIQAWSSLPVDASKDNPTEKKIDLPKTNPAIIGDRYRLQEKPKEQSQNNPNSEWPAPDIAKIRQEEKRQSLAAVDLPRFPRTPS
jgi:hypothetical protein